MLQDMSMYGSPPTCNLVTPNQPSTGQAWKVQQEGAGFDINRHDGEPRDHCWKKGNFPPPPGPPPPPPPSKSDFVLVLQARFVWWRAGTVSVDPASNGTALLLNPWGLQSIKLQGFGDAAPIPQKLTDPNGLGYCNMLNGNTSQACIAFALEPGENNAVAFTTQPSAPTKADTLATIAKNRDTVMQSYDAYGPQFAWAAEAVSAAVGWNFKFHPSEVGPHLPVSPSWQGGLVAPYDDFNEGGTCIPS